MVAYPTRIATLRDIVTLRLASKTVFPDGAYPLSGPADFTTVSQIPIFGYGLKFGSSPEEIVGGRFERMNAFNVADVIVGGPPISGDDNDVTTYAIVGNRVLYQKLDGIDLVLYNLAIPDFSTTLFPPLQGSFDTTSLPSLAGNNITPQCIFNGSKIVAACGFVSADGDGRIVEYDQDAATFSTPVRWAGYDSSAGGGNQFSPSTPNAIFPDPDNDLNYLLWAANSIVTFDGPLLVVSNSSGGETGRFILRLDEPAFNLLFQNGSGLPSFGFRATPAGFMSPFQRTQTNVALCIGLNPECTEYTIFELIAVDAAALEALSDPNFGTFNQQQFYFSSFDIAHPHGGEVLISGLGPDAASQSTLFVNTPRRALAPPFLPAKPLVCVPCEPQMISAGVWQNPYVMLKP